MQHMVVISETQPFPVRAEHMHMCTTAQSAGLIRRRNTESINIVCNTRYIITDYHPLTMMEIILPLLIRIKRPADKGIAHR